MDVSSALLLIDPKFPHNVGAALRAASCFGAKAMFWTGDRVLVESGGRLPREERMKAYQGVEWRRIFTPRPIDVARRCHLEADQEGLTPVAVELLPGAEPLHTFEHPEKALYVFGPEDDSLPGGLRRECHRFVQIPSFHCLNLAAAVYVVLYDRAVKLHHRLGIPMPELAESRGGWHTSLLELDRR